MIRLGTSLAVVIKRQWLSVNCRYLIIELSFELFIIRQIFVRLAKLFLQYEFPNFVEKKRKARN